MGIRIELVELLGEMEVVELRSDEGWTRRWYIDHAEFKAACCRDLGLVDLDMIKTYGSGASEEYVCNRSEDMRKAYDAFMSNYESLRSKLTCRSTAADVLAAASRRLA